MNDRGILRSKGWGLGRKLPCRRRRCGEALFDPLLEAQVVGVVALLGAFDRIGVQMGITSASHHLVAVLLPGEVVEGGLNDASPQRKHQV